MEAVRSMCSSLWDFRRHHHHHHHPPSFLFYMGATVVPNGRLRDKRVSTTFPNSGFLWVCFRLVRWTARDWPSDWIIGSVPGQRTQCTPWEGQGKLRQERGGGGRGEGRKAGKEGRTTCAQHPSSAKTDGIKSSRPVHGQITIGGSRPSCANQDNRRAHALIEEGVSNER